MSIWSGEAPVPVVFLHGFATSTQMTWVEPELVRPREGGQAPTTGLPASSSTAKPAATTSRPTRISLRPLSNSCRSRRTGRGSISSATRSEPARRSTSPCATRNWCVGWCWVASAATSSARRRWEPVRIVPPPTTASRDCSAPPGLGRPRSSRRSAKRSHSATTVTLPATNWRRSAPSTLLVIGTEDFAGPPGPLAELLPNVTVKELAGVDHFSLPKQFGFINAAYDFLDCVPSW